MPRVIHFEIPAEDVEKAVNFYSGVFNWKIEKWEGPMDYWLVFTGEPEVQGIDGAIFKKGPDSVVTNTIEVPSVEEFIKKIINAGGSLIKEKITVPGVGYMAYCKDPEGNTFGIIEENENAH